MGDRLKKGSGEGERGLAPNTPKKFENLGIKESELVLNYIT